jgi:riboflavin transporter FmnP
MNDKEEDKKEVNKVKEINQSYGKTKMSAVFLAIFLGIFAWLYTIKKSAAKFIVGFFVPFGVFSIYLMTNLIVFLWLFFLASFAMWLWALIDTAIKPETFYTNYPKE